jgi:spore maturation protein CgeB
LRAAGATGRIEYVPIGVDPEVHRPLQLTAEEYQKYQSDVCFIGGLGTAFHSQRRALVEYAIEQGVKMKIWGGYREHFTDSPILRCWQGQIWGEEQVKAMCASKIGLNFHGDIEPAELAQGLNVRAFELPACGVFQLMERVPSVSEFFEEDKEIVCFESKEEMIDKIRFYLTHETDRRRIAEAGKRRVLSEDTWRSRVHQMLSHLEKLVTVDGI